MSAKAEIGFRAIMQVGEGASTEQPSTAGIPSFEGTSRAVVEAVRTQIGEAADGRPGDSTEAKARALEQIDKGLKEWFKAWEEICLDKMPQIASSAGEVLRTSLEKRMATIQAFAAVLEKECAALEALVQKGERCEESRLAGAVLTRGLGVEYLAPGYDSVFMDGGTSAYNPALKTTKDFKRDREALDQTLAAIEKALARIDFVREESPSGMLRREEWVQISDAMTELKSALRTQRRAAIDDKLAMNLMDRLNPAAPNPAAPKEERPSKRSLVEDL